MFGEHDFLSQGEEFGCTQNAFIDIDNVYGKVEQFLMYDTNHKRSRPLDDLNHWACSCNTNTNIRDDSTRISWDGTKKRTRFKD